MTSLADTAISESSSNGTMKIEGIVPPFEERLAEFQKRARELQDELQIAILPYIKQYNNGQTVAAIEFVDRLK